MSQWGHERIFHFPNSTATAVPNVDTIEPFTEALPHHLISYVLVVDVTGEALSPEERASILAFSGMPYSEWLSKSL